MRFNRMGKEYLIVFYWFFLLSIWVEQAQPGFLTTFGLSWLDQIPTKWFELGRLNPNYSQNKLSPSGFQTETKKGVVPVTHECITTGICDICDGHKMSHFRICDLGQALDFFKFLAEQIWSQSHFGHKCHNRHTPWHSNVTRTNLFLFLFSKEMVRSKWNSAKHVTRISPFLFSV